VAPQPRHRGRPPGHGRALARSPFGHGTRGLPARDRRPGAARPGQAARSPARRERRRGRRAAVPHRPAGPLRVLPRRRPARAGHPGERGLPRHGAAQVAADRHHAGPDLGQRGVVRVPVPRAPAPPRHGGAHPRSRPGPDGALARRGSHHAAGRPRRQRARVRLPQPLPLAHPHVQHRSAHPGGGGSPGAGSARRSHRRAQRRRVPPRARHPARDPRAVLRGAGRGEAAGRRAVVVRVQDRDELVLRRARHRGVPVRRARARRRHHLVRPARALLGPRPHHRGRPGSALRRHGLAVRAFGTAARRAGRRAARDGRTPVPAGERPSGGVREGALGRGFAARAGVRGGVPALLPSADAHGRGGFR